jgi:hypothetical protein
VDTNFTGVKNVANTAAIVVAAADEAAMLALGAAVQVGDICRRIDNGNFYNLTALPASTLGNWLQIGGGGGSSLPPWITPAPYVPPQPADFTEGQNHGTSADLPLGTGGQGIVVLGSGVTLDVGWETLVQTWANVNGSVAHACFQALLVGPDAYAGIVLAASGTGKFVFFGLYWDGVGAPVLRAEKFNADGTSAGTLGSDVPVLLSGEQMFELSVICNNPSNSYTLAFGNGGAPQVVGMSIDPSAHLTPDQVGVGCTNAQNGSYTAMNFVHWSNA